MDLQEILTRIHIQKDELAWEGSFRDYFEMVTRNPMLARLSHARIYDAILSAGTEIGPLNTTRYSLFSKELFGVDLPIQQLVEYFRASALGFDTRKRILLLMGPPASGKSTLVNCIKRELERYTGGPEGALYAIRGCPMQEEPLHLIPVEFRSQISQTYGLTIEGDLCPNCRWRLEHEYNGDIEKVPVRRVALSEQMGIGIGTFVATDPESAEISRLIGTIDETQLGPDRIDSFGKAYRLNGEINVANRGLLEFVELFKLDERFLSLLLVLSEEQKIKTPGFGTLYADEALIAHTNETEYETLVSNRKTEGLQDRIVVIRVPYNLKVSDEVRIYEKLLGHVDLKGLRLSPLCLPLASIFAVLSRLEPSNKWGLTPVKKMFLYDDELNLVPHQDHIDVAEVQGESPREGMFGISPRFVINQISRAAIESRSTCLDPLDLLQTIWNGVDQNTTLAHAEQQHLYQLFLDTRRAYDQMAIHEVQKAFISNFNQAAQGIIQDYLSAVNQWLESRGEAGSEKHAASLAILTRLRKFEANLHIQDYDAETFRREIYANYHDRAFTSGRFPTLLVEAAIQHLGANMREIAEVLAAHPDEKGDLPIRREEVRTRLINEHGYDEECAERLLGYVSSLFKRGLFSRSKVPKKLGWLRD